MKKSLIILGASALMLGTSCGGSTTGTQPQTTKDSAGYAAGIIIGANVTMTTKDSTFDVATAKRAIDDVFAGKEKEVQIYTIAAQIAQSVLSEVDSTMNPDVILAGISDYLSKKSTIRPEEAGQFVMSYITKKQAAAAEAKAAEGQKILTDADAIEGVQKTESGLRYLITEAGEGPKMDSTMIPVVKYTLYDYNNGVIDSGSGFEVTRVVPGFMEGVQLLAKGGKAKIWVPSDLGYGAMGQGSIGPGQTLIFEIEVEDVKPMAK